MPRFFLLSIIFSQFVMISAFAQTNSNEFMSSRDLLTSESPSNISLQNNRSSAVTVYGLYVRQYARVTPGQSCNSAIVSYPASNNITGGSFVMPTVIASGGRAAVGSNYLYNMIYEAIYYLSIIGSPVCSLPGCTWGSDTTQYNWCIYLGALAPVSTSAGYTANVPPSSDMASSAGLYNYNLISNYNYLGPISCDDRTLTCSTANQQTQSFS